MTRAGGIDMPGEIAGMVALEEVLVHGWDLARATGQPFAAADEHLGIVVDFFTGATDESPGRRVRPSRTGRRGRPAGRSGHRGVRAATPPGRPDRQGEQPVRAAICSEGILF